MSDTLSNPGNEGRVNFPAFHERSAPMTSLDMAHLALAQATRQLVRNAFVTTEVEAKIAEATELVQRAVELVSDTSGDPMVSVFHANFRDHSPFMGDMNPIAAPMVMSHLPDVGEFGAIEGRVVMSEVYEGPPGHVHGGFLAGLFDEVLGMAQSLTGRPGMTGKLDIAYRSPSPLFVELVVRGWVERVDGRKIFTTATLHHGDTLCAEAHGLFISMPPDMMDRLRKGRDAGRSN
jgi:acyl-coenzyme A thioesterase PaaI-like protein